MATVRSMYCTILYKMCETLSASKDEKNKRRDFLFNGNLREERVREVYASSIHYKWMTLTRRSTNYESIIFFSFFFLLLYLEIFFCKRRFIKHDKKKRRAAEAKLPTQLMKVLFENGRKGKQMKTNEKWETTYMTCHDEELYWLSFKSAVTLQV